jgi:hypothetical protein
MGNAQTSCPRCGRLHAPYVAYYVMQGWNELKRGAEGQARAAFTNALKVTPPTDKPQLQSYIAYLVQQAQATGTAAPQPTPQVAAVEVGVIAPPRSTTVSAPAPRAQAGQPSPTAKRALFLNFNEKPMNIVRVMDEAKHKQIEFAKARRQRLWLVALLLPAGLPFVCADVALGYNILTFSLVALVLWGAAMIGFILLARDRPTGREFGPKFDAAHTIFETIKDDLSPRRTLIGWLDLTGPQQPGKVVRQATSSSGMPINHYRDEWLKMKMALYDGNVMRVSALERVKARMGRWKRGRSGKMKWKSGSSQAQNELRVALTVNKEAYEIQPHPIGQTGPFMVNVTQGDGRILLTASTGGNINGPDVLQVLRLAYDQLKPRGTPAS